MRNRSSRWTRYLLEWGLIQAAMKKMLFRSTCFHLLRSAGKGCSTSYKRIRKLMYIKRVWLWVLGNQQLIAILKPLKPQENSEEQAPQKPVCGRLSNILKWNKEVEQGSFCAPLPRKGEAICWGQVAFYEEINISSFCLRRWLFLSMHHFKDFNLPKGHRCRHDNAHHQQWYLPPSHQNH